MKGKAEVYLRNIKDRSGVDPEKVDSIVDEGIRDGSIILIRDAKDGTSAIITEGLTNESGAMVRKVSDTEIEGFKVMGTFCYNRNAVFPMYFVLRVSKVPDSSGYWKKQRPMTPRFMH